MNDPPTHSSYAAGYSAAMIYAARVIRWYLILAFCCAACCVGGYGCARIVDYFAQAEGGEAEP